MTSLMRRIWTDQSGFVASTDLLLISTILVIGLTVGLVTLRDQIVQEFGDLATALGNLNQSYSFAAVTVDSSTVAGSSFEDLSDLGELGTGEEDDNGDPANQPPGGLSVTVPADEE